jgi:hypothetical protein
MTQCVTIIEVISGRDRRMGKSLGTGKENNRATEYAPKEAGLVVRDIGNNSNTAGWRETISGRITGYMDLALEVDEYILK